MSIKNYAIDIYRRKDEKFGWRFLAPNDLNTGNGSEGYATFHNARRAAIKHVQVIRTKTITIKFGPEVIIQLPPSEPISKPPRARYASLSKPNRKLRLKLTS